MIKNRERSYINTLKGIAIFLMIWGHCIQYCSKDSFNIYENPVFQGIYSFHMPLFMLISGYLFFYSYQKRDLKPLLIHKTQGLLQPIVFAGMLNILLERLPTFFLYGDLQIDNGRLLNSLYTLWFLWCVLSASIAVAIAAKLTQRPWLQPFTVLLGFFLVNLFPENHYHHYMYPYFAAGFFFGMYRDRVLSVFVKLSGICIVLFPVLLRFYRPEHFIYITPVWSPDMDGQFLLKVNAFRWVIGFVGSGFVMALANLLYRYTVDRQKYPRILKCMEKLGENSLAIYCVSVSLLSYYLPKIYDRFVLAIGWNLFAGNIHFYNFVFTPVLAFLYCMGLYCAVLVMKKIRIHALIFGR